MVASARGYWKWKLHAMEISIWLPQKSKAEHSVAKTLLDADLKTSESTCHRDTCTSEFFAALLTIARKWEQPRCLSMIEYK